MLTSQLADTTPASIPNFVESLSNKSIMKEPMKEKEDAIRANIIGPSEQLVTMGMMGTSYPLEGGGKL